MLVINGPITEVREKVNSIDQNSQFRTSQQNQSTKKKKFRFWRFGSSSPDIYNYLIPVVQSALFFHFIDIHQTHISFSRWNVPRWNPCLKQQPSLSFDHQSHDVAHIQAFHYPFCRILILMNSYIELGSNGMASDQRDKAFFFPKKMKKFLPFNSPLNTQITFLHFPNHTHNAF